MGKRDTMTKNYMKNPERFADFINGYVYGGKQVICAEDLVEIDSTELSVISNANKKPEMVQRIRDVVKKAVLMKSDKAYYVLFGIENQSDIHYAMPVRNMLYNALNYTSQVENISIDTNPQLNSKGNKFLSKFGKYDKIIPVITITLYWGADPWDAPTTLKEMYVETDEYLEGLLDDFDCHLFSIVDLTDVPEYKTELEALFKVLTVRNSADDIKKVLKENKLFEHLTKETTDMICEFANVRHPKREKDGNYNMCKAIAEWEIELKSEGKAEGIAVGKAEGIAVGKTEATITYIRNAMNNSHASFDEVCTLLGVKNKEEYRSLI